MGRDFLDIQYHILYYRQGPGISVASAYNLDPRPNKIPTLESLHEDRKHRNFDVNYKYSVYRIDLKTSVHRSELKYNKKRQTSENS